MMARVAALLCGLLAAQVHGAALRRAAVANVPKGECYECEVTCFEDCLLKFNREIILPDVEDQRKLDRAKRKEERMTKNVGVLAELANSTREYRADYHTKDGNAFSWRTKGGPTRSESTQVVIDHFEQCLEAEKCAGHRAFWRTSWSPAAAQARKNPACAAPGGASLIERATQCSKPAPACSSKTCLTRAIQQVPALLQEQRPPLHPVKVNTFSTGKQGLEQCFKSCLAATCGCQDAPGFDAIAKMDAQVKANDQNGDPVEDTAPTYNYRPAEKDECAGGMAGFKVNKGLYTALAAGWLEVCTEDFLKNMMVKDINKGLSHCKSNEADFVEYGCIWNDKKGACVWGLKPVARCSVRFMSDKQ